MWWDWSGIGMLGLHLYLPPELITPKKRKTPTKTGGSTKALLKSWVIERGWESSSFWWRDRASRGKGIRPSRGCQGWRRCLAREQRGMGNSTPGKYKSRGPVVRRPSPFVPQEDSWAALVGCLNLHFSQPLVPRSGLPALSAGSCFHHASFTLRF